MEQRLRDFIQNHPPGSMQNCLINKEATDCLLGLYWNLPMSQLACEAQDLSVAKCKDLSREELLESSEVLTMTANSAYVQQAVPAFALHGPSLAQYGNPGIISGSQVKPIPSSPWSLPKNSEIQVAHSKWLVKPVINFSTCPCPFFDKVIGSKVPLWQDVSDANTIYVEKMFLEKQQDVQLPFSVPDMKASPLQKPWTSPWPTKQEITASSWPTKQEITASPWTTKQEIKASSWTTKQEIKASPWPTKQEIKASPWTTKQEIKASPWTTKQETKASPWTTKQETKASPWTTKQETKACLWTKSSPYPAVSMSDLQTKLLSDNKLPDKSVPRWQHIEKPVENKLHEEDCACVPRPCILCSSEAHVSRTCNCRQDNLSVTEKSKRLVAAWLLKYF